MDPPWGRVGALRGAIRRLNLIVHHAGRLIAVGGRSVSSGNEDPGSRAPPATRGSHERIQPNCRSSAATIPNLETRALLAAVQARTRHRRCWSVHRTCANLYPKADVRFTWDGENG